MKHNLILLCIETEVTAYLLVGIYQRILNVLGVAGVGSSNDFENRSDPMKVSGSMPPSPANSLK